MEYTSVEVSLVCILTELLPVMPLIVSPDNNNNNNK